MKTFPHRFPATDVPLREIEDGAVVRSLGRVLRVVEQLRDRVADVLNFNTVQYISQNAQPTPEVGQIMVWKDADAASGQPSHYLLYNDTGTIAKWTSSSLVP